MKTKALAISLFLAASAFNTAFADDFGAVNSSVRAQTLSNRINEGLSLGKLTPEESRRLSLDLQSILNSQSRLQSLNPRAQRRLQADLDRLSSRLDLAMRHRNKPHRFYSADKRIQQMQNEIKWLAAMQQVSIVEAAKLQRQLQATRDKQAQWLRLGLGLTYWQSVVIDADLDKIASRLENARTISRISLR